MFNSKKFVHKESISIYKDAGFFIVEIDTTKRTFESEEQLLQYLEELKPKISDYELEVSEGLWALVINFLSENK